MSMDNSVLGAMIGFGRDDRFAPQRRIAGVDVEVTLVVVNQIGRYFQ